MATTAKGTPKRTTTTRSDKAKIARELVINTDESIIDQKEIDALRAQFETFDADGNGKIEKYEFVEICSAVGLPKDKALELVAEIDDNADGMITFDEYMHHGVLYHLSQAVCKQRTDKNADKARKEARTHVNVGRIVDTARAKMENSRLAFSFLRHITFLCIYSFVVIQQRSPKDSMAIRAAMKNYFSSPYRTPHEYQIKSWMDIQTHEELWDWQQILFAGAYHQDTHYNGDAFNRMDRGTLVQHLRLTSGFRLTQRRSKNGTCSSYPEYAAFTDDCYADTFVNGQVGLAYDETAFKGKKSGAMYTHRVNTWHDKGFFEEFDQNRTATDLHLQKLRDDLWVDKGTRFFRIDLVAYSSNTGQFAMMELSMDMRVSGAMVPSSQVYCRRYDYYQTTADWFRLALEALLVLFWCGYIYKTVCQIVLMQRLTGRTFAYFGVMSNIVDLAHFSLLGASICMWIYIIADPTVRNLEITESSITLKGLPVNFASTTTAVEVYFATNGINMLVGLVRVMKFLRMNAYMGQLTDALELMKDGLAHFILILILVIVIFTFLGMMLFGEQLLPFADPVTAIDSVMGFTVGFSDPAMLFETNIVSALIFYVPFVFIMLFFVLPLTIAIIMDGYGEMQHMYEQAARSNLQEVVQLQVYQQVHRGLVRSLQFFVKNKEQHPQLRFPAIEDVLTLFAGYRDTPIMPYSELRKKLRDKNIPEDLLVALIEKFNAFQPDPDWHYLTGASTVEIDAQREALDKEDSDPAVLGAFLDDLEDRLQQILADQSYAHKKLDLLCEIFPT
mmetsp:Transcript_30393/g.49080  ORF Transcript_30393/g.49080 Transcript_30393/m.49080 type:complete len:787 (+) Transcript_30393:179-2539(+)|eukprot:CAMPEP_0179441802 /NCGR_PEP_ID=MMETSP0799-20121207/25298_1 /TAXON_ID=46947 /ORGANISM="Geminigera cryophila, Strain CCMP2564" /LENGTH=786 /DNA_ID=CAMNT_0021226309 /DNA_START=128 /DNA_END=2488 /DNA_ORIENTATION=-